MNIILLGAAGFIGTNLVIELAKDPDNKITVVDRSRDFFTTIQSKNIPGINILESEFDLNTDFDKLVAGQDVVYHLVSTIVPTTSNRTIPNEIMANVVMSAALFEACVHQGVKKVVFISSGGTIYDKDAVCPLDENAPTNPITSYGVQKITIEKLLYMYHYMHGLDYRIIRLSNPYGPYQRPNGILGAVTTFTYKALKDEEVVVYGDGSVVRDFIYIDDAVRGILNIVNGNDDQHVFNLGCGYGTSIRQVLKTLASVLDKKVDIRFTEGRKVDVPVNFLNIARYESAYGCLNPVSLEEGIRKTALFLREFYGL
ncbi:MAG: NAD-dependent epimerase/dehydratase family protein [Lachnospiraceae bacterium]|nr:NAD-dependent epimerase/dehydratase family protein [Lachnospiraceae bacterium]